MFEHSPPVSTIAMFRLQIMNITLYPLGAYVSGYCLPFTIELDGMDQADYGQAVSKGLFEANYKKGDGNVLSSCCRRVVSAAAMWLLAQWLNVAKNAVAFL